MAEIATPSSSLLSRPSILRAKSSSNVSIASNESKTSINITFAPLPVIEPRKRRSNRPIGLAGRAEMLRKSRRHYISPESTYEVEDGYVPQREDDEIQLPDVGRLVKGLWRSLSRGARDKNGREATHHPSLRSLSIAERHEGDHGEEDEREGNVWMEEVTWSPTLGFAAASFSIHDAITETQDNTSSGSFLEKLEGMKDAEGGKRDSDEHDSPHMKPDAPIAVG